MTDQEIRDGVIDILGEKLGYDLGADNLRPAEDLIIEKMIDVYNSNEAGVQSESIDDLSVSYFAQQDPVILDLIHSIRKLKW